MNIKEVEDALREARPSFYRYPNPVVVYWHWTAGGHYTSFRDYHFALMGTAKSFAAVPLIRSPRRHGTGIQAALLLLCAVVKGPQHTETHGELTLEMSRQRMLRSNRSLCYRRPSLTCLTSRSMWTIS